VAGSTDNNHYNHYSLLATVEQNWGLPNLGRGDATATVFAF
jgi:acid phosphatase